MLFEMLKKRCSRVAAQKLVIEASNLIKNVIFSFLVVCFLGAIAVPSFKLTRVAAQGWKFLACEHLCAGRSGASGYQSV